MEEENKECVICRRKFKEYGNNALPIIEGRCCDYCNNVIVVPFRIRSSQALDLFRKQILEQYGIKEESSVKN